MVRDSRQFKRLLQKNSGSRQTSTWFQGKLTVVARPSASLRALRAFEKKKPCVVLLPVSEAVKRSRGDCGEEGVLAHFVDTCFMHQMQKKWKFIRGGALGKGGGGGMPCMSLLSRVVFTLFGG